MIARSFKSVGWVAGVGAAALGCYMLSLQVAAERADLAGVEARIVRARQAIRDLQTELGTRGRLSQLEQWNAEVLALSAPVAGQYVENEVVLARLETRSGDLADGAQLRLASAETGDSAPAAAPQPQVRTAAAISPPAATAAPQPAPSAPLVRRASLSTVPAALPAPARPAATRTAAPAATPARKTHSRPAAPARSASLLDEGTARELNEAARAERGAGGAEPRGRTAPPAARTPRATSRD